MFDDKSFRITLYVLVGVFALLLISSFVNYEILVPKTTAADGFWVTISGNVSYEGNISLPNYVTIYPQAVINEDLRIIFQGSQLAEQIAVDKIDWKNGVGFYSISLRIPVDMKVIVTANDIGCLHYNVLLSKNNSVVIKNLIANDKVCHEISIIPNDTTSILDSARNKLDWINTELNPLDTTSGYATLLSTDMKRSANYISDSNSEKNESTKAKLALEALYYSQRASLWLVLSQLNHCVN